MPIRKRFHYQKGKYYRNCLEQPRISVIEKYEEVRNSCLEAIFRSTGIIDIIKNGKFIMSGTGTYLL